MFIVIFFMVAYLQRLNSCHLEIATVKNYNLNLTEVLVSDFKNAFCGIFNFTVGILFCVYDSCVYHTNESYLFRMDYEYCPQVADEGRFQLGL